MKLKTATLFTTFALMSFMVLAVSESVSAQSPSSEVLMAPTQIATESTTIAPSVEQELITLNNTYRGQLAEYRTAERAFQIASQQYVQLNTLVSLETALQTMKRAIILRDQVLITYLSIIQIELRNTPGINLDQKDTLVTSLETQLGALEQHLASAQAAESRDEIVAVSVSFEIVGPEAEQLAYQVQTIVATGKLQTVYDKSVILTDEIDQNLVSTTSDIKQPERQRAMTEVRSALGRSKVGIDSLLEDIGKRASRSSFQTALKDLNQVYGDLNQVLDYLDELIRL